MSVPPGMRQTSCNSNLSQAVVAVVTVHSQIEENCTRSAGMHAASSALTLASHTTRLVHTQLPLLWQKKLDRCTDSRSQLES